MRLVSWLRAAAIPVLIVGLAASSARPQGGAGTARPGPASPTPPVVTSLGLSSFAVIHSATVSDYQTYQFKFTYLGPQLKVTPSLGGTGSPHVYNRVRFLPYLRSFDYSNDRHTLDTLTVSAAEFKSFLDALAPHPSLIDTTLRTSPRMSLMVLKDAGAPTLCWEHLAPTAAQTDSIFSALHDALPDFTRRHIVDIYRHQMAGVRR